MLAQAGWQVCDPEQVNLTAHRGVAIREFPLPGHGYADYLLYIDGKAAGVLERATYDLVAFRYVAANEQPDHDTLNTFRKRFLQQIEGLMVQVLLIAHTLGVVKLGNIALDGTKVKANASPHSALSYGHSQRLEQQLKEEVGKLLALAEAADNDAIPDGMDLPAEIALRSDRLEAIAAAKAKIQARARDRFETEQADYHAKRKKREAKAKDTGKPPRGQPPTPPEIGPADKDQVNLTDDASRIMKVSGGGFAQCYNAQVAVDMHSLLIVGTNTVQACNDTQQIEPMLKKLDALPDALGNTRALVADTGFYSEANVNAVRPTTSSRSLPSAGRLTIPTHWNGSPNHRPWLQAPRRQRPCATASRQKRGGRCTANANARSNP